MGDTPIAGASQAIGQKSDLLSQSSAGAVADLLNTPDLPLSTASWDDFSRMTSRDATNPFAYSRSLKGDDSGGSASGGREDIIKYAKRFIGMPYAWGGSNPNTSFDCSGLVQYVAKKFGLNLPRISAQQARSGTRSSIDALRPGDLVAWDNSSRNNGADHIAFYVGNGYILEAAHTGTNIRIRKLGKNEGAWGVQLNYPK